LTPSQGRPKLFRAMITGFNTDVEYQGRTFHVQTEDSGIKNPVVESLIYVGGEILVSRRAPYHQLIHSESFSELLVQKLMEHQHQALIREILAGKVDPDGPRPFGAHLVSGKSLDEVVLDFLAKSLESEAVRLEMESTRPLVEGTRVQVSLRLLTEASGQPVPSARVTARLISTRERARELFAGLTNAEGRVEAEFDLQEQRGANTAVLFQAHATGRNAEIKLLVGKRDAAS
jgi:hypothetical protein